MNLNTLIKRLTAINETEDSGAGAGANGDDESRLRGTTQQKEKDKEKKAENEDSGAGAHTDKRKLIDEVGGILKGKVDEELWRTIIGKIEKIAYDKSEAGTASRKKWKTNR